MDEKKLDVALPHVIFRFISLPKHAASIATTMERLGVSVLSISNPGLGPYFFGIFGKITCTEEELAKVNLAIDTEIENIKKQKK